MTKRATTKEDQVVNALRDQVPVKDLAGVSISNVRQESDQPFDLTFELRSGSNSIQVLGDVRIRVSPKLLEEIAPWIKRLKSLRGDVAIAVIAPMLSQQAQTVCIENGIDFIDLAGNIFINIPGKFLLQRSGMRNLRNVPEVSEARQSLNVFSGRSSRVLRVLLENPKAWTVTEIEREIVEEGTRSTLKTPAIDLSVSMGAISKAISSLEDQLLIRRRGTRILVTEPKRLLQTWAEKYKERYRWRLRSSFQIDNAFGGDLDSINRQLKQSLIHAYVFSGVIAASQETPVVDVDIVEVFTTASRDQLGLSTQKGGVSTGPKLRFIYPYDLGVFMYSRHRREAPVVSDIQIYLDLYARGGRDLKQAEYLLENAIQPRWGRI